MPFFLLLLGGAVAVPIISNAVDNLTEKPSTTVTSTPQNAEQNISSGVKWVVIIAGSVLAIKYGSKLIKKI